MSTGPSRRLRHVLASLAARPEPAAKAIAIDPSEPINRAADAEPPQTLLSEAQVKAFVQHGFLALPCADLGDEWHRAFGERCCECITTRHHIRRAREAEAQTAPGSHR